MLGIPEDIRLAYLLPLGKPDQERDVTRARLDDLVHYNRFSGRQTFLSKHLNEVWGYIWVFEAGDFHLTIWTLTSNHKTMAYSACLPGDTCFTLWISIELSVGFSDAE